MPINPSLVVHAYSAVSYDGTNGADIAAAINNASVVSDTGAVLTLNISLLDWQLAVGDWIVWRNVGGNVDIAGTFTDAHYGEIFAPLPS